MPESRRGFVERPPRSTCWIAAVLGAVAGISVGGGVRMSCAPAVGTRSDAVLGVTSAASAAGSAAADVANAMAPRSVAAVLERAQGVGDMAAALARERP